MAACANRQGQIRQALVSMYVEVDPAKKWPSIASFHWVDESPGMGGSDASDLRAAVRKAVGSTQVAKMVVKKTSEKIITPRFTGHGKAD